MTLKRCSMWALLVLLSGCATYAPPKVDTKTGLYPAIASVDRGGILKRDTVNLARYRVVLLAARSNVHPARFEFFARSALLKMGFKQIVNPQEMARVMTTIGIDASDNAASKSRVEAALGPVLVIDFESRWDGDVRRYVTLRAMDLNQGSTLLHVNHPKMIWVDEDSEALYPVLNELKKWVDDCARV